MPIAQMAGESLRETWLAVFDGRFLPVDSVEISISRDTQNIAGIDGLSSSTEIMTGQHMTGTIETRREPAIKLFPTELRLYGPDKEWCIWNMHIARDRELDTSLHVIEFEATNWECGKY